MKRIISCLASLLVASATAVAMISSAAATNPNKDPNGDGVLDVSDATYIYQTLGGRYNPSDLTQLDLDDNGVVSDVDALRAQYYDAGVIILGIPNNLMRAASYASQTYVAFDAKTGRQTKDYMLQVQNSNNARSNGNESIVDGRVEDWSNRGVAKIITNENGESYLGSGFVVDKHTIATAAHLVYDTTINTACTVSSIMLFDGSAEDNVTVTPVEYHLPTAYTMSASSASGKNYDFALITVKEDLSDYMSFNLGMVTSLAVTNHLPIVVAGFPGKVTSGTGNNAGTHTEYISYGMIKSLEAKRMSYTADTSGGNSGGPIYTVEELNGKTYYTVVGIHTTSADETEANSGVRFTPLNLKFFLSNPNIEY
ncbi:MAG: trypsin-like peptidase domain-containing protein [Alistipes sp.]|nr:trypsin-like peptidase domain-containing protein [Alistipes sp.]